MGNPPQGFGVGSTVQTGELDDGAVTTVKLADNAVDKDKLGILTTKGDSLTYSTEPARLAVGTNAQVLSADSGETTGLKWVAAGGGGWKLIESILITSATQDKDFAATLDGDVDRVYQIIFRMVNDDSTDAVYSIRINGNAAGATRQRMLAEGTTVSGATASSVGLSTGAPQTTSMAGVLTFSGMTTGDARQAQCFTGTKDSGGGFLMLTTYNITTPANTVNVTALGIGSDQTSGIGVGTEMFLFARSS